MHIYVYTTCILMTKVYLEIQNAGVEIRNYAMQGTLVIFDEFLHNDEFLSLNYRNTVKQVFVF